MVARVAATRPCWVRVNRARSELCERDLEALAGSVLGLRIPKVESAADVAWVADRAPGVPLDCTVESAGGVLAAFDIASAPACALLSYGGLDLTADLGILGADFRNEGDRWSHRKPLCELLEDRHLARVDGRFAEEPNPLRPLGLLPKASGVLTKP